MPGENIWDWSPTAIDNGNADSAITWVEHQARASVNNSSRSMMAAHAKVRNLQSGSIVTTGTANAQAFSSGYSPAFTTIPTGFSVKLKIGAGLTTTDAFTLNMDAIGPVAVKEVRGNDVGAGIVAGRYYDFLYDGTNWLTNDGDASITLQGPAGTPGAPGGAGVIISTCGKLRRVSDTLLSFLPYRGTAIQIAGQSFAIPTAGIAGLANTSVFVDGVAASPLVGSTTYLVCAFDNAGVVTADFRTNGTHETSDTPGNVSVEILTGDDSRSVIGMVRTGASGEFIDIVGQRLVRTWFNDNGVAGYADGNFPSSYTAAFAGPYSPVEFLAWAGEPVAMHINGLVYGNVAGTTAQSGLGMNAVATPVSSVSYHTSDAVNSIGSVAVAYLTQELTEGYNSFGLVFYVSAGAHTVVFRCSLITNGN